MEPKDSVSTHGNVTLDDFCRLCLQQCGAQNMRPFRSRLGSFGTEKVSIPDMLVYICGLPSNASDELPQRVCQTCFNRLESAYFICRDFKEKETILDRFYLNGFVLQRLIQYEKFRFDSDGNEDETTMEKSNGEMESNENDTIDIKDVFSMNVSQSGMEEEDFPDNQMVQPAIEESPVDCSDDPPTENIIEINPQNPYIIWDSDSDDSGGLSSESSRNPKKAKHSDDSGGLSSESSRNPKKAKQKHTERSSLRRTRQPVVHPGKDGLFHCGYCPRRFTVRKHYLEHMGGHRALIEERHKCPNPDCGRCFRKKDQLNRHKANCILRQGEFCKY